MKRIKKLIALTLMGASILTCAPITAHAEWRADNNGWWYTEGSSYATGWRKINGLWYYFYSDGYMAHDTTIEGYYVNSNGVYEDQNTAKSGYYKVGVDIDPGEYLIISGDYYGYYECTLDQSGSLNSVVYNNTLLEHEPSYITVNYGEYLKVDNVTMYKMADAPSIKPSNNVYSRGQYKVGRDIPAGTYTVSSTGAGGTVQVNSTSRHDPSDARLFEALHGSSMTITVKDGEYLELIGAQIVA